MQRILMIAANQERMPDPIPPIGAAYIAAAVREHGHVTKVYDACFSDDYVADLTESLQAFKPTIVGLSIRNVDNVAFPMVTCYLDRYLSIVRAVRAHAPDAVLFIGGSAYSLFPEEFMEKLDVDYGVVGEGENVFVRMVNEIDEHGRVTGDYANEQNIVFSRQVADLDAAVDPARDLLAIDRYFEEGGSINIQTKRGCGYKCIYCTYPVLEGNDVRTREPAKVVDEIERAKKQHDIDFFFFVDNVFNAPTWHVTEICEEILRRDLKVQWTAYVTPAGCTRELFELMRRAGCRSMEFGTDAASDAQLSRMGKDFDVAQIMKVSEWCHEFGIKFNHSLIYAGPGETWDTVKETTENIIRTGSNATIAIIGVRIYRDTPMAKYVIQRNQVTRDQIGIIPIFFIEEEVKEGIVDYLGEVATQYKNWIVPGIRKNMNERFFRRVRSRGVKGPLWELFDPQEYDELPPVPAERAGEA